MIIIEPTVARNIVGQLVSLVATPKWPERPPARTLRGVDFYSATDLIQALTLGAQTFKNKHGYLPSLASPETFSEHIFLRKFLAPLPMPSLADKLAAYDYVKARLGDDLLPFVVWVGDNIGELFAAKSFAGRVVLKANNGCGFNMFLNLPGDLLTKRGEIEKHATRWLGSRYGYAWGEWQYCTFKPRLFLEAFLDFNGDDTPDDFKVFCFGGKARLIEVDVNRFTNRLRTAFYDPSWKHFPVGYKHEPIERERPGNLDEMIGVAETIAKDMEFARVDLYSDGKHDIKFGEITFAPGDATSRFSDPKFDRCLGSLFGKAESTDRARDDGAILWRNYHMWRTPGAVPVTNTTPAKK
jgi:hypothetical protein